MERNVIPGQFYRHFKDKLYQIITVAKHSETMEDMVVYQALYGDYGVYVRPYDMFVSEVDHVKYPEVKQKYRFELVRMGGTVTDTVSAPTNKEQVSTVVEETVKPIVVEQIEDEENQINPYLLRFLDADTYQEKRVVLEEVKDKLDETAIHSMAMSMDFTLTEGTREDKILSLFQYLRTLEKYECNRLR